MVIDKKEFARASSPSRTAFQRKMLPSISGGVRVDTSDKEFRAHLSWIEVLWSDLPAVDVDLPVPLLIVSGVIQYLNVLTTHVDGSFGLPFVDLLSLLATYSDERG